MNNKKLRVITKYAYLPTKIEFLDGTSGFIWLAYFDELQEYKDDFQRILNVSRPIGSVAPLYYSKKMKIKSWQCIKKKKKIFLEKKGA